jgi:predicted ATP-dependent endonuclease of OLD family
MEPIYLDLHIHTSEDPNNPKEDYDFETLLAKVSENARGESFLISITDHNFINEKVYSNIQEEIEKKYKGSNIVLGVELHIRKYRDDENSKAYHCHIFFDLEDITQEKIQDINKKLNLLYKNKTPNRTDKDIPLFENVIDIFEEYEFSLLPHGGQKHSTFSDTIRGSSGDKNFDNVMYKSLYYNFFDGFTARSENGIKVTREYLKTIGLDQFVGVITSSDNYKPEKYPEPRSKKASNYIPTWTFASPTFDGLRIALSDNTRLSYGLDKPKKWDTTIASAELNNSSIEMNVKFTAGLNVIIGGSSSGKTLIADSINRKLHNLSFENKDDNASVYNEKYSVEEINVSCRNGLKPYYIHQNYISDVINSHGQINEIEPLDKLFPDTSEQRKSVSKALNELKEIIDRLFSNVEKIERFEKELEKTPILSSLIVMGEVTSNLITPLLNEAKVADSNLSYQDYEDDSEDLERIHELLENHPIVVHSETAYKTLIDEIGDARDYSSIHGDLFEIVAKYKEDLDKQLEERLGDGQKRKKSFEQLINRMRKYGQSLNEFDKIIIEILKFKRSYDTREKEINGHRLYFKGSIRINEEIVKDALNEYLLKAKRIIKLKDLTPKDLYADNFSKTQLGNRTGAKPQYNKIATNVYANISEQDQTQPKILTKTKEDFEKLSPGKKTAVILDLILSYEGDNAPIIIDQPEDNLSSEYMNTDLIDLIKEVKYKKQVIFVSHNATIPMIGDSQNIILCRNQDDKIVIKSAPLDGEIDNTKIVDYIVSITDGGKQSVKKRFKKYNLKNFDK